MSIDYRTLLAEQIEADWKIETETVYPHDDAPYTEVSVFASPDELADDILATRIPDLCPDCGGEGVVFCADDDDIGDGCDHPNAPTIGDLLRWGENVAKAKELNGSDSMGGDDWYDGFNARLHRLRTEADR